MKILQSIIDKRTFLIITSLHMKDMLQQRHRDRQDEEFARQVLRLPVVKGYWDMELGNIVLGSRTFHRISF